MFPECCKNCLVRHSETIDQECEIIRLDFKRHIIISIDWEVAERAEVSVHMLLAGLKKFHLRILRNNQCSIFHR